MFKAVHGIQVDREYMLLRDYRETRLEMGQR